MKKIFLLSTICLLGIYYIYPEKQLKKNQKADKIVVYKSKRELQLLENNKLIACYTISLGKCPVGPKKIKGDHKTPEGIFKVRKHPNSKYHNALDISYNNYKNNVEIHGLQYGWVGKFHRFIDWTDGCIALTNNEIDEIYEAVDNFSTIEIKP